MHKRGLQWRSQRGKGEYPAVRSEKKLAYVINCKVCFNSEKIHHNIPFQANEKKFNGIEWAGVQVGTISLIGTYGCPPPISKILATCLAAIAVVQCMSVCLSVPQDRVSC